MLYEGDYILLNIRKKKILFLDLKEEKHWFRSKGGKHWFRSRGGNIDLDLEEENIDSDLEEEWNDVIVTNVTKFELIHHSSLKFINLHLYLSMFL